MDESDALLIFAFAVCSRRRIINIIVTKIKSRVHLYNPKPDVILLLLVLQSNYLFISSFFVLRFHSNYHYFYFQIIETLLILFTNQNQFSQSTIAFQCLSYHCSSFISNIITCVYHCSLFCYCIILIISIYALLLYYSQNREQ